MNGCNRKQKSFGYRSKRTVLVWHLFKIRTEKERKTGYTYILQLVQNVFFNIWQCFEPNVTVFHWTFYTGFKLKMITGIISAVTISSRQTKIKVCHKIEFNFQNQIFFVSIYLLTFRKFVNPNTIEERWDFTQISYLCSSLYYFYFYHPLYPNLDQR